MRVEPLIRVVMPRGRRWVQLSDLDPDHLETFNTKLDQVASIAGGASRMSLWQRLFRTRFPQRAD